MITKHRLSKAPDSLRKHAYSNIVKISPETEILQIKILMFLLKT